MSHDWHRGIPLRLQRALSAGKLGLVIALLAANTARGDELLLADPQLWPGEIFSTDGHRPERRVFRIDPQPRGEGGGIVPRIAAVAAVRPDEIYFCSGLDGRIQRVNRTTGAHQVVYMHEGLVRDLAIHPKTEELYFSQVDAPDHGERLRGGAVYRFDRQRERGELVYEADQSALGYGWLGAIAFDGGKLHLAMQSRPARVVRVEGKKLTTVFESDELRIRGLAFADERLLIVAGDGRLLEVTDGQRVREVMKFSHNFTSLAVVRPRHDEGR